MAEQKGLDTISINQRFMVKPGRYRHFKGKEYEVLGVARHSEDLTEFVVYRALYGDGGLWIRPCEMFVEQITVAGVKKPRFEFLGD